MIFVFTVLAGILENLKVYPEKMLANLELSRGEIFSSRLLTALVEKGKNRDEAWALIQQLSHLGTNLPLQEKVKNAPEIQSCLQKEELKNIFSLKDTKERLSYHIQNILKKWNL